MTKDVTINQIYNKQYYSKIILDNISVNFSRGLVRQDMDNQIWKTLSSKLAIKPDYNSKWIIEELDLDDDEITVTITTKKGKVMEFTKKLEIYNPSAEELHEWDETHEHEFISRMRDPPANQVGGNTGIIGDL